MEVTLDEHAADTFSLDAMIGRRIRVLRALRGLTLAEVASQLGVSSQQLQKYETGVNRVSAGRLYELAELLDCQITDFFQDIRDHAGAAPDAADGFDVETLRLARMLQSLPDPSMRASLWALVETLQEPKTA
mgnify:CR=1 FL=1